MRTPCSASAGRVRLGGARRFGDERGAVLVHVAVAFTGLVAFSALTIDLGVLWVARTQAQNAADAAALAGAVTMAYGDRTDTTQADLVARAVASANPIWGAPPGMAQGSDLTFPPCPPGVTAPTGRCVRAEVHREPGNGGDLPIYIAALFGLGGNSVRAMATATVLPSNSTNCLRPWAIPDRWDDVGGDPNRYERYRLPASGDRYEAPGPGGPGTGYQYPRDFGRLLTFNVADFYEFTSDPNWTLPNNLLVSLDLPRSDGGSGASGYEQNIATCRSIPFGFGGSPVRPELYNSQFTAAGVNALYDMDPGARWESGRVVSALPVSPRIVPIAVFDSDTVGRLVQEYQQGTLDLNNVGEVLPIVNIVGFFVERPSSGATIEGRIVSMPGDYDQSSMKLADSASFLRTIRLLR